MKNKIIEFVKKEHDRDDFDFHIMVVVKNALKLSEITDADKEVVEIAAFLHDIGRAHGLKPSDVNKHHITSAKKAELILRDLKYPEDKIRKIVDCILSHRGNSDDFPATTLEQKIITNADAMAHFCAFLELFKEFVTQENFQDAVKLIDAKIERDWNKKLTMPEAREMVRDKYNAIRLLLNSMKEYMTEENYNKTD
ncbi:MAG: HD domain-containing protein [Nanoarchaeota archaeon]|nr:HD domain-containing protein [Nanoarchaeota archaeon]